jgi:hypothetical protein
VESAQPAGLAIATRIAFSTEGVIFVICSVIDNQLILLD